MGYLAFSIYGAWLIGAACQGFGYVSWLKTSYALRRLKTINSSFNVPVFPMFPVYAPLCPNFEEVCQLLGKPFRYQRFYLYDMHVGTTPAEASHARWVTTRMLWLMCWCNVSPQILTSGCFPVDWFDLFPFYVWFPFPLNNIWKQYNQ